MRGPDPFPGDLSVILQSCSSGKIFYLSSDILQRLLVGCSNKWECELVLPQPIVQVLKILVPPTTHQTGS